MAISYPWASQTFERLLQIKQADQLPHAIALTSAPGWGLSTILSQLVQMLVGVESTLPIQEIAHQDLRWLEPDGTEIKVQQIRNLSEFVVQTAQIGDCKVVGIDQAHLLNINAANALLKSLEEPVANTYLILATEHWGRVLPTIRSRCQRFVIPNSSATALDWLDSEGHKISNDQFAAAGYAPVFCAEFYGQQNFDISPWIEGLQKSNQSQSHIADSYAAVADLPPVALLDIWYRFIIRTIPQQDNASTRSGLLKFAQVLQFNRRQIATKNSANVRLLIEQLILEWAQTSR